MEPIDAIHAALKKNADERVRLEQARAILAPHHLRDVPPAPSRTSGRGRPASVDGVQPQWSLLIDTLARFSDGVAFANLHDTFEQARGKPIQENTLRSQLSRIKSAGYIASNGDLWSVVRNNGPDANLNEGSGPLSVQPEQEG